ncbi:MAG: S41 family peptidase [Vicinamibacterales bacterium]
MTFRTRLAVLLISTPLVAFAIIGGLLGKAMAREESYRHLRVFEDVVSLILNNYVEEVDVDKVMEGAMRGLADGLDADSSFLVPSEVGLVERNVAPERGEVGLELARQYYLRVVATRDGSAAARAGLRSGDFVRAIDGQPTRHMSVFEGMRRLHGAVGSKLELIVLRGSTSEPRTITLVREAPAVPAPSVRMVASDIALLRVPTFSGEVVAQVRARADEARKNGAAKLLIDLRGTAEGSLDNGVAVARLFVPSGTLTQKAARGRDPEIIAAKPGDGSIGGPIVLLSGRGTSGAAEIFVAALLENKRAELVGEPTTGRAGLQKLVKFSDGSGLLMTWSRFLTPSGKPIHGAGIEPTEAVEEPVADFDDPAPTSDPILEKGLARFTAKAAA